MTPEEQLRLVHDRIPMDYLMPPGAHRERSVPDAMKAYSEARWRLIDRVAAAEALNAELLSALEGLNESILGRAESSASGNPEWEYVSARINAARAAIAKATA
jgi:hypothetical protein